MIIHDDSMAARIEAAKLETKSGQAHRLVDYLHQHGPTLSGELCQACSIGNLSSAANAIRPALQKRGLTIVAHLPKPLTRNQFNEPSQSHLWSLRAIRAS